MRVIQIIDSLDAGGAERIAVGYSNMLSEKIIFSGLVATRGEGVLKSQLTAAVNYLFLEKKSTFDFKSVFRLRTFVKNNKVTIVHAHGTSFFIAGLLKLVYPRVKIVWHEHYGARAQQSIAANGVLFFCSFLFDTVFVVNHELEKWVKAKLPVKRVYFVPNFGVLDNNPSHTKLKGKRGMRIVCLANLKDPKNHIVILQAFEHVLEKYPECSLHFVGKDYDDAYSLGLKSFVNKNELDGSVFFYGSQNDISAILLQADIGVLASTEEGFPVTLLEYGLAKLAVVTTNAGHCSVIVNHNTSGLLFSPGDAVQLEKELIRMIENPEIGNQFAQHLHDEVLSRYSKETITEIIMTKYKQL